MNRILKFRLWDGEDFVTTNRLECYDDGVLIDITREKGIITQFTGLIDKNGKEIYEGDIINFTVKGWPHEKYPEDYKNQLVHWDDKYGCWAFGPEDISMLDRLCDIKVIGNVFENPELLTNK